MLSPARYAAAWGFARLHHWMQHGTRSHCWQKYFCHFSRKCRKLYNIMWFKVLNNFVIRNTSLLAYCMVPSASWEANWFAASPEIPRISQNLKVHYRTHKCPPQNCSYKCFVPVWLWNAEFLASMSVYSHFSSSEASWTFSFVAEMVTVHLLLVPSISGWSSTHDLHSTLSKYYYI